MFKIASIMKNYRTNNNNKKLSLNQLY